MRKEDHRNEDTKAKLTHAFRELSLKKGVAHVGVADITSFCHVNRNTFYYHFEDIRYLLNWMFEQDCAKVVSNQKEGDVKKLIISCINYVQENHILLKDTFENLGSDSLIRAFSPTFKKTAGIIIAKYEQQENVKLDDQYRKFLILFFCEAVGGIMLDYARGTEEFAKDELIDYLTNALDSIPLFITRT